MDDVNIGECFIEDRLVRLREVEIEPLGNRSHDGDVMLRHIEAVGAIRAKGHADDLMALLTQGMVISMSTPYTFSARRPYHRYPATSSRAQTR